MTVKQVGRNASTYMGLSGDTKPAADVGATFYETDTGDTYIYDGSWHLLPASGGGSEFEELTVGLGTWSATGAFGSSEFDLSSEFEGHGSLIASGAGAEIQIRAGDGGEDTIGGEMTIRSGSSEGNNGGDLTIEAGGDTSGGDGGNLTIKSGPTADGTAGELAIRGGVATGGDGGRVLISGGDSTTDGNGGNVNIQSGDSATGTKGRVTLYEAGGNFGMEIDPTSGILLVGNKLRATALPTANPNVAGQFWNDVGTVKVSAG